MNETAMYYLRYLFNNYLLNHVFVFIFPSDYLGC